MKRLRNTFVLLLITLVAAGIQTGCHETGSTTPATSNLSLLAGGVGGIGNVDVTGPNARFSRPYDTATDGTNLYVADNNNHTIRRIDLTTGIVSTTVGEAGVSGFIPGPLPGVIQRPIGIAIRIPTI